MLVAQSCWLYMTFRSLTVIIVQDVQVLFQPGGQVMRRVARPDRSGTRSILTIADMAPSPDRAFGSGASWTELER